MYQGHKTKAGYIKAWRDHASQLQWMYWDSIKGGTTEEARNKVDAFLATVYTAIDTAADNLEAAGKFAGE